MTQFSHCERTITDTFISGNHKQTKPLALREGFLITSVKSGHLYVNENDKTICLLSLM